MSLTQNMNLFAPKAGLGQPMKGVQPATFNVRINPSSVATGLQVGSPLKLIANTNTAEIVVDLAGATDPVFAVIPANTKKNTYAAGDVLDVFAEDNTMILESVGAINAGDRLALGNTSAVGGGPGATTTTTPGAQYGAIALTSVTASQNPILVKVKGGTVPSITAFASGTTVLVAGASTVANTAVTANSQVLLTLKTVGGTIAAQPYVATITPGTGFTVAGGGGSNTSTYNYAIIN